MELFVWMGIPILGVFSSGGQFHLQRFLLGFLGIIFFILYIILLNDWGGSDKSPKEIERFSTNGYSVKYKMFFLQAAILSLLMAFFLYSFLINVKLLLLIFFSGFILNILYSHPYFYLKGNFWVSTLLHFLVGEVLFLLGYVVASQNILQGLLVGTFYSLILTAGHFVHECQDVVEDRQGNLGTTPVRYGIRQSLYLAIRFFLAAHIIFMVLAIKSIIEWSVFFIFVFPVFFHFYFWIIFARTSHIKQKNISKYKLAYRLCYALCAACYVILNSNLILIH